jgi:radical SAM protein with 4Fe4S-binding SPASM domain
MRRVGRESAGYAAGGDRAAARAAARSLSWVDDFFRAMGGHIFAREEDGVVILPPNQVYKANATGIAIVRHMLAGGRVSAIPGIGLPERAAQVAAFVGALRALSLGEPGPTDPRDTAAGRSPFEAVPYTFQYTTLPILGEIAVTYRCNNACRFCYAGCAAAVPRGFAAEVPRGFGAGGCSAGMPRESAGMPRDLAGGREMTLAEVRRIIRVFKEEAKIPFFSLTGGEPLLRKDLEEMISYARSLGLEVNLITNGTLADARRARRLFKAGLRTAQVSIEAPESSLHDQLTARPGSFRETLAGIRGLQDAGVSVQTNTTVSAVNADTADGMPAFLKGLGVRRFAMNLYLPPGAAREDAGPFAEGLFFPYAKAGDVVERVRAAARAEGLTFYWYSPLPHCHYNTIARGLGNKSCAAMDGLLSVSAAGDVLPCSSYPESMGNLLTRDFRDIWFSERASFFKNKRYAPAECSGCGSFTACQAACPLYWRYAGTSEIRNPAARTRAAAV